MSNLFKSEYFTKYNTKSRDVGIGEIVTRNNHAALNIRPEPFYKNNYGGRTNASGALYDEFAPNTQYLFDMWIDGDDVVYSGNNVQCGFVITYSDNSTDSTCVVLGGNKGFQHRKVLTAANKTVDHIDIYYYTSMNVYYRWDSSITAYRDADITKQGVINTNIKTNADSCIIYKGGITSTNDFVEN